MAKLGEAYIELRADLTKLTADFAAAKGVVGRGASALTRGTMLGGRADLLSAMGMDTAAAKVRIQQVLHTQMVGLKRIEAGWKATGHRITATERARMARLRKMYARTAKLRTDALRAGGGRPGGAALGIAGAVGLALLMRQLTAATLAEAAFQREMAMVSTMVDNTAGNMPRLTQGVADIALEFGQTTAVVSKGLYDILSASIATGNALDVLRVAARAGVGGFTDTAIAVDGITSVLNAYGMEASEAGRVSDILFATVRRGKTTFPELASSIGRVASVAATAGVALEEVGAFLATVTRAGVRTDQAVVALNAILLGYIRPASAASAAADKLGVSLSMDALAADGLIGSLAKLRDANVEQLAAVFPNIRAIKGVTAAIRQLDGLQSDLAATTTAAGDSEAAFIKASDNAAFSMEKTSQAAALASRSVGQLLTPAFVGVDGATATAASGIAEVSDALIEMLGIDTSSKIDQLRKRFEELGAAALTIGERKAIGEQGVIKTPTEQAKSLAEQWDDARDAMESAREEVDRINAAVKAAFGSQDQLTEGWAAAPDIFFDIIDKANLALAHTVLSMRDIEQLQDTLASAMAETADAAFDLRRNQEAAALATERWVEYIKEGAAALVGLSKGGLERIGFGFGAGASRDALARTEAATLRLGGKNAEAGMKLEDVRHREALRNIAKELAAAENLTKTEMGLFEQRRQAEQARHELAKSNLKTEAIQEMIARDFAFEDELDKFGKDGKAKTTTRLGMLDEISTAAAGKLGKPDPKADAAEEAAKETADNTGKGGPIVENLIAIREKVGAWQ